MIDPCSNYSIFRLVINDAAHKTTLLFVVNYVARLVIHEAKSFIGLTTFLTIPLFRVDQKQFSRPKILQDCLHVSLFYFFRVDQKQFGQKFPTQPLMQGPCILLIGCSAADGPH